MSKVTMQPDWLGNEPLPPRDPLSGAEEVQGPKSQGYVWQKCYQALQGLAGSGSLEARVESAWFTLAHLSTQDFMGQDQQDLHARLHKQVSSDVPGVETGLLRASIARMSSNGYDLDKHASDLFDLLYRGMIPHLQSREGL